jgi:hypothetical protein
MSLNRNDRRRIKEFRIALLVTFRRIEDQLRALHQSLEAREQHENTIGVHDATNQEDAQPRPRVVVRTITEFAHAEAVQRDTERQSNTSFQRKSLAVQWCLFGATFLAFCAAAYYAHIAAQQKDTMTSQLATMRQAADIAAAQFADTIRPWLDVDEPPTVEEVKVGRGKGEAKNESFVAPVFRIAVKNFGTTIALRSQIRIMPMVVDVARGFDYYTGELERVADAACLRADNAMKSSKAGAFVIPNREIKRGVPSIFAGPTEMFTGRQLYAVGCIAYTFSESKDIHHTRFCYVSNGAALQITTTEKFSQCEIVQRAD